MFIRFDSDFSDLTQISVKKEKTGKASSADKMYSSSSLWLSFGGLAGPGVVTYIDLPP